MCSGQTSKCLLFLLNGFFVVCGAGLIGLGVWMKTDETFTHYLHVVNVAASNPFIDLAAWIFIVVGAAAFVIAAVGICGACRESQCLIFLYILVLFVLISGELVAAALCIVYRSEVQGHLEDSMTSQLQEDYGVSEKTTDAWDYLQVELKCCGVQGYTDYDNSTWFNMTHHDNVTALQEVPATCCVLRNSDYENPEPTNNTVCQENARDAVDSSEFLHTDGCYDSLKAWLEQHSNIMIAVAISIAAVQLLGFVAACCLRRQIRAHTYDKQ